jgi:hypothetical protein
MTTAGAITPLPVITTTAAVSSLTANTQAAMAPYTPTAVNNNPSSQRHDAEENGHRTLVRAESRMDLPNDVKPAGGDRV